MVAKESASIAANRGSAGVLCAALKGSVVSRWDEKRVGHVAAYRITHKGRIPSPSDKCPTPGLMEWGAPVETFKHNNAKTPPITGEGITMSYGSTFNHEITIKSETYLE